MSPERLSVRPLEHSDKELIAQYWTTADKNALHRMGADIAKVPDKAFWLDILTEQLATPLEHKKSYCTIWEIDGQPVGRCNVNNIQFGNEAYMHLQLWKPDTRQQGAGSALVRQTLPYFFNDLKLANLFCEPYALNPAPNKTLQKLGFQLIKEYATIPGHLSFEQPVKLWQLTRERYESME